MKTETENWETKFDEKFFQNPDGEKIAGWLAMKNGVYFEEKECSKIANPNDVKSFIRQLLQEARVEERGKIRRAISKMPISKTIGQILSLPELSVNPPQK